MAGEAPSDSQHVISFAQNGEDVVLDRAFSSRSGFYVDVGAGDPDVASVTRHFYELGWTGINIDPRADAAAALRAKRPRDVTLQIAAGSHDGTVQFFRHSDDPDLSSLDVAYAAEWQPAQQTVETVEMRRLDSVLEECGVPQIDFLKIDVEGAERAVLEGIDLERWGPRVVVIEAIRPYSTERTDSEWRGLLEAHGYRDAMFDGVNLFFVRADEEELERRLVPANVLDDFKPASVVLLEEEIARLRGYVAELETDREHKLREVEELAETQRRTARGLFSSPVAGAQHKPDQTRSGRDGGKAARPARPCRVAVIATPCSGNTWVRRLLSDALGAVEIPVHHPGDVDWADLPPTFILQLQWPRSRLLQDRLQREDVIVLSPARHPLDVLASITDFAQQTGDTHEWLAGSSGDETSLRGCSFASPAFQTWATSERAGALLSVTPDWWASPSTVRVRYEDLVDHPETTFRSMLDELEQTDAAGLAAALAANTPARLDELSGGIDGWGALSGRWREVINPATARLLHEQHRGVFETLGYRSPDADEARV